MMCTMLKIMLTILQHTDILNMPPNVRLNVKVKHLKLAINSSIKYCLRHLIELNKVEQRLGLFYHYQYIHTFICKGEK